jgi:hypothetical protein
MQESNLSSSQGLSIWPLIQEGLNDPQKEKREEISCWMFDLEAEVFSCSLDVLHGGLGEKIARIFSSCNFFLQIWIRIRTLTQNTGLGSALKPMRIYNTGCMEPPYFPSVRYVNDIDCTTGYSIFQWLKPRRFFV